MLFTNGAQATVEHLTQAKNGVLEEDRVKESRISKRVFRGLGSEIGSITIEGNKTVDAGRLLMRNTWNAGLPKDLHDAFLQGRDKDTSPDVWIHKNRMSGLWGNATLCTEFLEHRNITTLLFAGVNTDQCVGGSLQDAFTKGWDCIILRDACGTTSPGFASECIEYNCARTWGFVTESRSLRMGVDDMLKSR